MAVRDTRELFCVTFMTQSGSASAAACLFAWFDSSAVALTKWAISPSLPLPSRFSWSSKPYPCLPPPLMCGIRMSRDHRRHLCSAWDLAKVASWVIRTGRSQSLAICVSSEDYQIAWSTKLRTLQHLTSLRYVAIRHASHCLHCRQWVVHFFQNHKTQTHSCTVSVQRTHWN